jgi:hypothetical protein
MNQSKNSSNFTSQVVQPFSELLNFISAHPILSRNLTILSYPTFFVLFRNNLVYNEELLIVFCFLAAIYFLCSELGDSVAESLDARNNKIKSDLLALDAVKLVHLESLYSKTEKVLNIQNEIRKLETFSVETMEHLDASQKSAFIGLISKNMNEKFGMLVNVHRILLEDMVFQNFYAETTKRTKSSKSKIISMLSAGNK